MKKQPKPKPNTGRGRPVNLYLRESDLLHIRQLGASLMQHGHRVSDSQVIRAACAMAKPGPGLLKSFETVLAADGRRRKD